MPILPRVQNQRPATNHKRWLAENEPLVDSISRYSRYEPYDGEDIRPGSPNHEQSEASLIPGAAHHQARQIRVPDIVTYYGLLILLLVLIRVARRWRRRERRPQAVKQEPDHPTIIVDGEEHKTF